ncbi:L,D-transpeptidase family protein [Priestia koreensis]|uniref:L,D-transpeptidase family protein n=1 Tax=Priestia koreensis TaxID=284581 RepID=UPI00203DB1B5|nr:L,D-transpeptidase family protein [Priestia koreensis]MCM3004593.1 L,D-transpeptidase family protein [Priestia koreensis]
MKKKWIIGALLGSFLSVVTSLFLSKRIRQQKKVEQQINDSTLSVLQKAEQLLIVTAESDHTSNATLVFLEKRDGSWKRVMKPISVLIGKHGMTTKKQEGDGKSPIGVFSLGTAFGHHEVTDLHIPYRQTSPHDYWVDDVESPDYNTWVHENGNPEKRWSSFERMNHPLYKYGIVVNYNEDPIIPGKGSAIFMHLTNKTTTHTAGCVAMPERDFLPLLYKLEAEKHPAIVIAEKSNLLSVLS